MALSKPTTSIEDLPSEMLDHILAYLPLSDRKQASLVCLQWAQQAFSYHFLGLVRLRLKEQELLQKRAIVDALQNSSRPYRNLTVDFGNSGIDVVLTLILLNKFGDNVEIFGSQSLFAPSQLREILLRMPRLKRLIVNVSVGYDFGIMPLAFPVLTQLTDFRSTDAIFEMPGVNTVRMLPNIRNLSLYFRSGVPKQAFESLKTLSPQLKMLEVFADFNYTPINQLDLRQVETLKLWGNNFYLNGPLLGHFFVNKPLLTTLFLHVRMSQALLDVICTNCPGITTIGFIADSMEKGSLRMLEKLPRLKILLVDGCLKSRMMLGCRPLSSVETFCLYWHKKEVNQGAFVAQLHQMMPNLRTMKVIGTRDKQMDTELMSSIGRTFIRLRRLTVADFDFAQQQQLAVDGFDWLADLANVEQLTLSSMRMMTIGSRSRCSCRVSSLRIENFSWLIGDGLLQMAKMFPELRYLKVNRCTLISQKDIDAVRRVMPNCVINFVDRSPRWIVRGALNAA